MKNSRENIAGKKRKKSDDKKLKKTRKCLVGSYQEDTRPNYSMDGAIRSMTGSIGKKWKKIGNDGKGTHS